MGYYSPAFQGACESEDTTRVPKIYRSSLFIGSSRKKSDGREHKDKHRGTCFWFFCLCGFSDKFKSSIHLITIILITRNKNRDSVRLIRKTRENPCSVNFFTRHQYFSSQNLHFLLSIYVQCFLQSCTISLAIGI